MNIWKGRIGNRLCCALFAGVLAVLLTGLPLAEAASLPGSPGLSQENPAVTDSGVPPVSGDSSSSSPPAPANPAVSPAREFQFQDKEITVRVLCSDMEGIPENGRLSVSPITDGKKYQEVKNRLDQKMETERRRVTGFLAYDISIRADGVRYEPKSGTFTVRIQYGGTLFDQSTRKDTEEIRVFHLPNTGAPEDVTQTVRVRGVGTEEPSGAKAFALPESADSRKDAVEFSAEASADGDSVFAVTGTAEAAGGIQTKRMVSTSDLRSGLAPALPYAVFADYFYLKTHMEGCIAVNRANIGAGFGNSENNYKHYSRCGNTITVEKTYRGSATHLFRFGLYRNGQLSSIKTLTLPFNGVNGGTVLFPIGLDCTSRYTVQELDDEGKIIRVGGTFDGVKLVKSERGRTQNHATVLNNTSYIKTFEAIDNSQQLNTGGNPDNPNRLVVGSPYEITSVNQGKCVRVGGGQLNCTRPQDIVNAPAVFPIDFNAELDRMAEFSALLAGAVSSDTVTVQNRTVSQLENAVFSPPTDPDKMLLINLDASGQNSDFEFPSSIKWSVGNADRSWVPTAENVLINVYQRQGDENFAYTGTIRGAGHMLGTLLAPRAEIRNMRANYNGRIIAKSVTSDEGEIHGSAGGRVGESVNWTFENADQSPVIVLPSTGGTGTAAFYGTGGGMILFAVLWRAAWLPRRAKKRKVKPGG